MLKRSLPFAFGIALAAFFLSAPASLAGGFDSWAAVVVAGDAHAHSGAPSEVFDNGRRDIAKGLEGIGFAQSHVLQFSTQPGVDKDTHPGNSDLKIIYDGFKHLAQQSSGGCFIYVTSHGSQSGVLIGNELVSPQVVAQLVDDVCADRMTIVVISACYSGVFIPPLQRDTRMIITAARRDRTSFGCGESNRYTYFDECVINTLPTAPNFPGLAYRVQDCVAAREKGDGVGPPSEPQISLGAAITPALNTAYIFPGK